MRVINIVRIDKRVTKLWLAKRREERVQGNVNFTVPSDVACFPLLCVLIAD